MPLVSASLYLLDLELQNKNLLSFLGFEVPISTVTLANQIIAFSRLKESSKVNGNTFLIFVSHSYTYHHTR